MPEGLSKGPCGWVEKVGASGLKLTAHQFK